MSGLTDVAIEALGTQSTFESALRVLRPGGMLRNLGVYSGKFSLALEPLHTTNLTRLENHIKVLEQYQTNAPATSSSASFRTKTKALAVLRLDGD